MSEPSVWANTFDAVLLGVVWLGLIAVLLWVAGLLWRLGAWLEKPRDGRRGVDESVTTAEFGSDNEKGGR